MSATYTSGGATLAYREMGPGLPVVFLHPTPLDGRFWLPMVSHLPGVRAILPDLRGHGLSELGDNLPTGNFEPVPDAPVLRMGQLADDFFALLDHLGLQQAVVAGCSIGGYVLLEIWRRAPERIRGMAFLCSKPQSDAPLNALKRAATIAAARAKGNEELFAGMAKSLTGLSAQARRPEILAELTAQMALSAEAVAAVQAGLALRPDSLPTVPTIDVPVLALAGGEDPGIAPTEMEAFRLARGGCDFHLLPDAGHFAAYEQPETVAALLNTWLQLFR